MPTWIGDTVMAMPALRALRGLYPDAHITALVRRTTRPIVNGCPWIDRQVSLRRRAAGERRRDGVLNLARRVAKGGFDTAVVLPNSFRSALLTRMAGIPRRIGYDRDGRGFLLTDRLLAPRVEGRLEPIATHLYYLGIAQYLGAIDPDPKLELFTRPEQDAAADGLLRSAGFDPDDGRPLVLINPGASYGDAKIWYPDRFAEVADRCVRELGAVTAVTGAPGERRILDRVLAAAREPMIDLQKLGVDLSILKSVVRRSSLMVTNDTGPRHLAAALNVPVVTVFGPTDPRWTEIDFADERMVRVDVFCGPCQKKRCPLDHRCMTQVSAGMVYERVVELMSRARERGVEAPA